MKALQVLKGIAKRKLITTHEYTKKALEMISNTKEIKIPHLTQKTIDEGRTGTQRDITHRFKQIGV